MKILIAGGAGYVGSVLVPHLIDRGYQVSVVDLFWFGNHLPAGTTIIEKDVFRIGEDELSEYEQVVFLAGLSNDPMAEFSPRLNFIFNSAAPAYLAYLSKRAGIKRFVYASSGSVYGYSVEEFYNEDSPALSVTPYGISKLQGERAVMQLRDDKFSVICLRKGTICGYSPRMRLDLVVNTMFMTAQRDHRIVINNPSIWRPILSIQDTIDAYTRAIETGYEISGIFNFSSGNYTVGEIGDIVSDTLHAENGVRIPLEIKNIADFRNYKLESQRAERVLSFKPRQRIEGIVRDLLQHKDRFLDFENPAYYNIRVFEKLTHHFTI